MATKTLTIQCSQATSAAKSSDQAFFQKGPDYAGVTFDSVGYADDQSFSLALHYSGTEATPDLDNVAGSAKVVLKDKNGAVVKQLNIALAALAKSYVGIFLEAKPGQAAGEIADAAWGGGPTADNKTHGIYWYVDAATFATGSVEVEVAGNLDGESIDGRWTLGHYVKNMASTDRGNGLQGYICGKGVLSAKVPFTVSEA